MEQLRGMEKIRTRITKLETIIKTWKEVLDEEQPKTPQEKLFPSLPEGKLVDSLTELTHVEGVSLILKEAGHSLSLNEIESEYRKRKWKLSEKNGGIILRRTLKRPDLFTSRRGEKGLTMYYGLKTV
jgi:hypothetical protein